MSSVLILPDHTEMKALEEKLGLIKDFQIVSGGERPSMLTRKLYIDLTFDIFNRNITERVLYNQFAELTSVLELFDSRNSILIAVRHYPFRTNLESHLRLQRIVDSYISFLNEFYEARILFIPNIISRHCFQFINNPPVRLINAVRLDKTEQIAVRDNSRFFLIYEMDILDIFQKLDGEAKKNHVIEGLELSLADIYQRTIRVTGNTPVSFNSKNFINYEYPSESSELLSSLNYDLEDMVIDITSFLF